MEQYGVSNVLYSTKGCFTHKEFVFSAASARLAQSTKDMRKGTSVSPVADAQLALQAPGFTVLLVFSFVMLVKANYHWAHGVVVSHPLRMRKALGSIPSVSILYTIPFVH